MSKGDVGPGADVATKADLFSPKPSTGNGISTASSEPPLSLVAPMSGPRMSGPLTSLRDPPSRDVDIVAR